MDSTIFSLSASEVLEQLQQGKALDKVESEMLRVIPQRTKLPFFKDAREFLKASPKCLALTEAMKDVSEKRSKKIQDALEKEIAESVSLEASVDAFLDSVSPKLKKLLSKAVQQQVTKKRKKQEEEEQERRAEGASKKKQRKLIHLSQLNSPSSPKPQKSSSASSTSTSTKNDSSDQSQAESASSSSSSTDSNDPNKRFSTAWYQTQLNKQVRVYSKKDKRTLRGTIAEYSQSGPPRDYEDSSTSKDSLEWKKMCCLIKYDSGRREWLDLSKAMFEIV